MWKISRILLEKGGRTLQSSTGKERLEKSKDTASWTRVSISQGAEE
jgi:hypothetical protein